MDMPPNKPGLSKFAFSGAGFLCIYFSGVAAALELLPKRSLGNLRVTACSSGSIIAAGLVCGMSAKDSLQATLQVIAESRASPLTLLNKNVNYWNIVRKQLEKYLPENAHFLCTNHLFISLTRYKDGKNVLISNFSTNEDLIQAILCSCAIPYFFGPFSAPEFRGEKYIDGGFSNGLPVDQFPDAIKICPFSGEFNICPDDALEWPLISMNGLRIRLSLGNFERFYQALFPQSQQICAKLCKNGFFDTLRFLQKNGHIVQEQSENINHGQPKDLEEIFPFPQSLSEVLNEAIVTSAKEQILAYFAAFYNS